MFKYNGKIWNPKNPEKKLKQLGITWDDVEIIEEAVKPKDISGDIVDTEKISKWFKIVDISTNNIFVTIYDKAYCMDYLKRYTECKHIDNDGDFTIIDYRFIICPYLSDFSNKLNILKIFAYRTKDGFSYIDIIHTLIDLILEDSTITDEQLARLLQSDVESISNELMHARDLISNNLVKYVPFDEYSKYYKLHSKEQIKKHFGLTDEQYKTTQKKFGYFY